MNKKLRLPLFIVTSLIIAALIVGSLPGTIVRASNTDVTSLSLTKVNLTKGPELVVTKSNTSKKIFWQWNANSSFRVDWGTTTSYGKTSATISAYNTTSHLYSYTITSLTPGTKYYYRVVTGTNYAPGSFRAAPPASGTTLKFVSYGDTRTNYSAHNAVAKQVDALFAADPAYQTLNVHTGDLISSGDTDSAWTTEFFSASLTGIRTELANMTEAPIMGNHEASGNLFKRYFPEPWTAARYYSLMSLGGL